MLVRGLTSIEEELFGLMIHIIHTRIEKLAFGHYIARQGEQKDWLQNFCFALSFAQTNFHIAELRSKKVRAKDTISPPCARESE